MPDATAAAQNGEKLILNKEALEPLYAPWQEPTSHRVKAPTSGASAQIIKGRRPTPVTIANNLRAELRAWRESFYLGASETTRHLLNYWFERAHRTKTGGGEFEFRYFFCQREATEAFIYLKEIRRLESLSQVTAAFGGPSAELAALGITDDEDLWSRYAFKLATGAGKTKCMSLAIVWSYFHAIRESDSPMAKHFVVVAPNLTVFERLKDDFKPEGGGPDIFDRDPLIPAEWRGDWNLSVVLQDEVSGAETGGVLYLTNIHRLYDTAKRKSREMETYEWMGPAVTRAKALDTGAELRDRVTSHPRVMILNDEAHHVWDPDSAWNEAIRWLHDTIQSRSGNGLCAQLDYSATPKDNRGILFKHIVCDAPLGEAVDGGIVKVPIIGQAKNIAEMPHENAAYKYEMHLRLGYERWRESRAEWEKSGKKALLFVMCEDTRAADEITQRLNTDPIFPELHQRTINLHTNLKGKIKKVGRGAQQRMEFVEDEGAISDEDLKALRKLSRELDENTSPYFCIVSVLMLREGWDVRNVTTIVPLRAYSSTANILPEQTLGRGLRRMTPPGEAAEVVTVVEHEAFARLNEQELVREGLPIEIVDVEQVPRTTVSIFPDETKDLAALEIEVPKLSAAHSTLAKLEGLKMEDVRKAFTSYKKLPFGAPASTSIDYEGKQLITGEVVELMKVELPLLSNGIGALSFFVRELEHVCRVRGTHGTLAPLVQEFIETLLFEEPSSIFDPTLVARLADPDVREHIRAVFIPLIRRKTVKTDIRNVSPEPVRLSQWRPFQVTASERHPVLVASNTLFNLVPCNQGLEQVFVQFLQRAPDVTAFAKNAGPQCLRIDYLSDGMRLAFYTPDFFVRTKDGRYFLIETKGRVDKDVPVKARAAVEWCKSASASGKAWEYVYVPQGVFEKLTSEQFEQLFRVSAPALQNLLQEKELEAEMPLFAFGAKQDEKPVQTSSFLDEELLANLPSRYRHAAEQASEFLRFALNKPGFNLAPCFTALLGVVDEACKGLLVRKLQPSLPAAVPAQKVWFEPYLQSVDPRQHKHYQAVSNNLRKTLVFNNGVSPIGLLRNCLDFALNDSTKLLGVFDSVKTAFRFTGARELLEQIEKVNDFRNTYIAHQSQELTDGRTAERMLSEWVETLHDLVCVS